MPLSPKRIQVQPPSPESLAAAAAALETLATQLGAEAAGLSARAERSAGVAGEHAAVTGRAAGEADRAVRGLEKETAAFLEDLHALRPRLQGLERIVRQTAAVRSALAVLEIQVAVLLGRV